MHAPVSVLLPGRRLLSAVKGKVTILDDLLFKCVPGSSAVSSMNMNNQSGWWKMRFVLLPCLFLLSKGAGIGGGKLSKYKNIGGNAMWFCLYELLLPPALPTGTFVYTSGMLALTES